MGDGIDRLRERFRQIPDGSYLIGLSGGADSVALIHLLLPDIRSGRIRTEAVHVNHGLRGAQADGDEAFTEALCAKVCVPFIAFRVDLGNRKDEAAARDARYAVFRERIRQSRMDGLILAHHANDQAETFLMRILRGAGPEGLSCMKFESQMREIRVFRPMLGLKREEIRRSLLEDGIEWREDSTNADPSFLRNRIRLELIPLFETIEAGAVEKICRAAGLIGEDCDLLNLEAEKLYRKAFRGRHLDTVPLESVSPALLSRVLRRWWESTGPVLHEHTLNERQTTELAETARSERGCVNLPGGYRACKGNRYLHLIPPERMVHSPVCVTEPETCFGSFRLLMTGSEGNPGDGKRCQEIPPHFTDGCVVRTRRPGDRIRPFGSSGSRKLQDYLTDRKVDEAFRDEIPLLCRENEVLLAGGVGAGEVPLWKAGEDSVRLTWHGDMPWMD